ncbi:hypothetical protein [Cellulomonas sp. Y8]|jgi:hypothetical protein|uniref:hypothetical protein n=1 Tax=Cellulomonas sp. Y8 TaxID=2591145 RepID=UPI003D7053DE
MNTALTVISGLVADLPNPDAVQPPGTEGFVSIMGWSKWVAGVVAIIGIMAIGAMMTVSNRRGEAGEHAGKIVGALTGVVLISAAWSIVGFLM